MAFDTIPNEKKENLGAVSFCYSRALFMTLCVPWQAVPELRRKSRASLLLPIERVRDHKSHNAKVE